MKYFRITPSRSVPSQRRQETDAVPATHRLCYKLYNTVLAHPGSRLLYVIPLRSRLFPGAGYTSGEEYHVIECVWA